MKYKGQVLNVPVVEYVVIPRQTGDIVFTCKPVLDYEEFDNRCKEPQPPVCKKPGGETFLDDKDRDYVKSLDKYNTQRVNYMIWKSVENEDVVFDTIDINKPETWGNFEKELKEAGLTIMEINRVIDGVLNANSLNQKRVDEALNNFLRGQAQERNSQ